MRTTVLASLGRQALDGAQRIGLAWSLTGAVLCIDTAWLALGGWSMPGRDFAVVALAVSAFLAPLSIARYRRDLRIRTTLRVAALLIAFQAAAATLSYLVISTNAALIDVQLAAWDRALGFDWLALNAWVQIHPHAQTMLHLAYDSGLPQLVCGILFLGFSARAARLDEFMRLFSVATLLVIVISGPFPAAGAWKHYAVGTPLDLSLSHFELLRNGSLHEIPLRQMQGLISIPSLHAAMAVLLVYAMRGTLLLPPFVILNAAMLVSTPVDGGHYLVDVILGVALALGIVALDRKRSAPATATVTAAPMAGFGALPR